MKPYDTDQTKKEEVREMFDRIAPRYDLLNHTLSMNVDRLWRRRVVREVRRAAPRRILDVATGTGDLAIEMARRIAGVQVLGVDSGGWTDGSSSTAGMPNASRRPTARWMWRPWRSGSGTSATSKRGSGRWPGS